MKRIVKYIAGLAVLAVMPALVACEATDTAAETQTDNIISYLESKLALVEGEDALTLGDSLYMVTDGIYKYYSLPNEDTATPMVQSGDTISVWFDIRVFTASGPAPDPVYSNIAEWREMYGMNDWPAEAKQIVVGNGDVIKSIDNALPLCRYDSKVAFIIPSSQLFDDTAAGPVLANTAMCYEFEIINKQDI
jgi:hypothetical protein